MSRRLIALVMTSTMSLLGSLSVAHAEHSEGGGGPCNGASLSRQSVDAHLVGRGSHVSPKIVFRVSTDSSGRVTGKLVLERGVGRLSLTNWCRMWQGEKNSSVLHVLGEQSLADGTKRYVRVDLKSEDRGRVRVMTKRAGHGGHEDTVTTTASESEGWTSLTGEGWLSLQRMRFGQAMGQNGGR